MYEGRRRSYAAATLSGRRIDDEAAWLPRSDGSIIGEKDYHSSTGLRIAIEKDSTDRAGVEGKSVATGNFWEMDSKKEYARPVLSITIA
jgi:hypothetical protein